MSSESYEIELTVDEAVDAVLDDILHHQICETCGSEMEYAGRCNARDDAAHHRFICRGAPCETVQNIHWLHLTDCRNRSIELAECNCRVTRAEEAGNEEAIDRILDRAFELRVENQVVQQLKGG